MDTMTTAAGEAFRFGFGETPLGLALVAESRKGVAAILLGDDRAKLHLELRRSFPDVQLIESDGMGDIIARVTKFVAAPQTTPDLPLDLHGTEQQLAVWEALQTIPAGETRSYGELAKSLSVPATAQEVGAACAANVLAVAVPCHRVVKADGSISGYRWGVARKRRLINMEAAA
jgi:AraC family transcriptional regulator of adaptative response/methylated-DNA-[protein]-cysteine methyltransferase